MRRSIEAGKGAERHPYAFIRLRYANDLQHYVTSLHLAGVWSEQRPQMAVPPFDEKQRGILLSLLSSIEDCANLFGTYHLHYSLAFAYCVGAEVSDILGDTDNRNRQAREALTLAREKRLSAIVERAAKLLRGENTFSSLRSQIATIATIDTDKQKAVMTEEQKARFVEAFLESYKGDTDTEAMRTALRQDVDDMVAVAKQRVEWCRHVHIIQDQRHERSLETFYHSIPQKFIVCQLFHYQSMRPGYSFDDLWLGFKGAFCLWCQHRSLNP